ncbi:MAG TPA: phosphate ABC transporter ATP-binding protein [Solirubrobacteraceae bacterium]|jgi:phosphate transport system ATP-binding protein
MDPVMPPPIKRIVLDRTPNVVDGLPRQDLERPTSEQATLGHSTGADGVATSDDAITYKASARQAIERMRIESVWLAYGERWVVRNVSLPVRQGEVLGLIGASGSGKTTLLRSLNRLTEVTAGAARAGQITLDGTEIGGIEVTALRRRISMVFQQPNPFPMSIYDNVVYALEEQRRGRRHAQEDNERRSERDERDERNERNERDERDERQGGLRLPGARLRRGRRRHEDAVITALQRAGLYDEVADDLDRPALSLSGGQQQRLCIARSLAVRPEVLLLDEPCSALDPISTAKIEELIVALRESVAIVIVTHNMQQARRVADHVAFMHLGELIEYGTCEQIFERSLHSRTREYVNGEFG